MREAKHARSVFFSREPEEDTEFIEVFSKAPVGSVVTITNLKKQVNIRTIELTNSEVISMSFEVK